MPTCIALLGGGAAAEAATMPMLSAAITAVEAASHLVRFEIVFIVVVLSISRTR
jgi:hypothetical protein